jgi:hypothetical protein
LPIHVFKGEENWVCGRGGSALLPTGTLLHLLIALNLAVRLELSLSAHTLPQLAPLSGNDGQQNSGGADDFVCILDCATLLQEHSTSRLPEVCKTRNFFFLQIFGNNGKGDLR